MINRKKSLNTPFGSIAWKRVEHILSNTCAEMNYYYQQLPNADLVFYENCLLSVNRRMIDNPHGMRVYDIFMSVKFRSFRENCSADVDFCDRLKSLYSKFRDYARLLYIAGVIVLLDWDGKKLSYALTFK